jgi:hypothetical protein
MIYQCNPRGILCQPLDEQTVRYYICLVDIPTSWGSSISFDGGVVQEDTTELVYTASVNMQPESPPCAPVDDFKTYLLPVYTTQSGELYTVVVQGPQDPKKSNGAKKKGTISNTPALKYWDVYLESDTTPVIHPMQPRPFVIMNSSNNADFYVGVFAKTPTPKTGDFYTIPFAGMSAGQGSTPADTLVCVLQSPVSGTANQVTAFGCIPTIADQFNNVQIVVYNPNITSGPTIRFNYDSPNML